MTQGKDFIPLLVELGGVQQVWKTEGRGKGDDDSFCCDIKSSHHHALGHELLPSIKPVPKKIY